MSEWNDSRYEQFETSPDTINKELRPIDYEERQKDNRFKENYSIDVIVNKSKYI